MAAGKRLANYLRVLIMEAQTVRAGLRKVAPAQPGAEDLVALTIEASAMARVPLAGTSWIPGVSSRSAIRRPVIPATR